MESLALRLGGYLGIGSRGLYSSPGSKPLHHNSDAEESDLEREEDSSDIFEEEPFKVTENLSKPKPAGCYSKLKPDKK